MTPILTITLLFWAMILFSATAISFDRSLRSVVHSQWKSLVLLLLATALWRVPTDGVFFHGMEYEDSYVYTVEGRQLAEHVEPPSASSTPFSIVACEVGSISDCQQWEQFPEHFMGYPYVISAYCRLFGYSSSAGSIINLFASLFSVLIVFAIVHLITDDNTSALIAGFTLAALPVFAVYGLETSAEPFSNLCILLAVWFFLRLCSHHRMTSVNQALIGLAYCTAICFSLTVKREDIVLAIVLPIIFPFVLLERNPKESSKPLPLALILFTSGLALILSLKMHLFQTSEGERELLRQFPFTLSKLVRFVGGFLSSFLVMRWYEGSFVIVGIGIVVALMKRGRTAVPVVLLASYILLYASHIRSYYEMASGHIEAGAALRFSMNFMGLWAITAGIGVNAVVMLCRNRYRSLFGKRFLVRVLVATGAATLLVSLVATIRLRRDAVEDEMISRLSPAENASSLAKSQVGPSSFIVTMEPLVIQMYEPPQTRIVDLEAVDVDRLTALVSTEAKPHLIFLKQSERLSVPDLERYGDPVRYVLSLPSQVLMSGEGFEVTLVAPSVDTLGVQGQPR